MCYIKINSAKNPQTRRVLMKKFALFFTIILACLALSQACGSSSPKVKGGIRTAFVRPDKTTNPVWSGPQQNSVNAEVGEVIYCCSDINSRYQPIWYYEGKERSRNLNTHFQPWNPGAHEIKLVCVHEDSSDMCRADSVAWTVHVK